MMTHASDGKQIRGEACDVHVDVDVAAAAASADDIAAVISNISQELSSGASDCLLMQPNRGTPFGCGGCDLGGWEVVRPGRWVTAVV